MAKETIPWHPAFVQALRLELEDYADSLEFRAEYQLTAEPLRIDVSVVKKKPGVAINKNIGRIFKTHNIFEFKSPRDSFSAGDLHKAFAYVSLYAVIEGVDIRDCSLTLAGAKRPAALMNCLKETFGHRVEKTAGGVYYVRGTAFPMQIIETKRLPEQENLWLNNLRDDVTARGVERVLAEGGKRREAGIAAYMYALMAARSKVFTEVWDMTKRQKEFKQLWLKIGEESGQLEEMRRQTEERTEQRVARQKALETARNALAEGLEPATIQRITGLSRETIEGITTCGTM